MAVLDKPPVTGAGRFNGILTWVDQRFPLVALWNDQLAKYYAGIFESDWKTGLRKIPIPGKKTTITPEAVARGNFVEVRAADYQEV